MCLFSTWESNGGEYVVDLSFSHGRSNLGENLKAPTGRGGGVSDRCVFRVPK